MPVVLKDPETERVVRKLAGYTDRTLTDAGRQACQARLIELRRRVPLRDRLGELRRQAKVGNPDPAFGVKAFLDDAWSARR